MHWQWCRCSQCLWGCFWTEVSKLGGIVGKIQSNKPGKWFEGCTFKSNFRCIGRYHIIFLFILNKGMFLFFLMLCFLPLFSTSIPKARGMVVPPICVQIHVHLDFSMIKLLPGRGAAGLTPPSGCGTAAGCCSGHLPCCS